MKPKHLLLIPIILVLGHSMYSQAPLFIPSDTFTCQGGTISFSNLYPNLYGYTYDWQFGDGGSDSSYTNSQHTYPVVDTLPTSLTIQGDSFIYVLKSFKYHYLKASLWRQFPFDMKVDPYIKVTGCQSNQNNLNTNAGSTNIPGGPNPNYTQNTNHALGLQCYTVKVLDYDATGADDLIGSFTLNIPGGSGSINNGNMHVSWVIDSIPTGPYTQNIEVYPGPGAPVVQVVGIDTVCSGDSVMLVTPAVSGVSFQWYKDGNLIQNANSDTFYAKVSGNYIVKNSTPNSICQLPSLPHYVQVNNLPVPSLDQGPIINLCQGDSIMINITGSLASAQYSKQWYKDGILMPDDTTSGILAQSSGSYYVSVNKSGCEGFSSTIDINIVVDAPLTISQSNNQTLCQGDTLILYATSLPTSNYRWHKDSLLIPGSFGLEKDSLMVTQAGDYYVSWENACGVDTSQTITVNVVPGSSAPTIAGPAIIPCEGNTILLSFQPDSNLLYQWQLNGINIPGAVHSSLSVSQSGNYQVVALNASQCQASSANYSLQFSPLPDIPILQSNVASPICDGSVAWLSTSPQTGISYQWYLDGIAISGATQNQYSANSAGSYYLEASNNNQCTSVSDTFNLNTIPAPSTPLLSALGDIQSVCQGDTAWLMADADLGVNYYWYKDNQLINGANSDLLGATIAGNYQVEVQNANGCTAFSLNLAITNLPTPQPIITQQSNDTLITGTYNSYAWMLMGSDSVLSTDPFFLPSQSGEYVVEVTNTNGCVGNSTNFLFNTTGINDLPQLSINIYPNPCIDYCLIELPKMNQGGRMDIYDLQGRNLIKREFSPAQTGQKHKIELLGMTEGVYLVRILSEGYQPLTKRLIIRH